MSVGGSEKNVRRALDENGTEWVRDGVDAQMLIDSIQAEGAPSAEEVQMVQTATALELEGESRVEELRRKAAEAERERNHADALEKAKDARNSGTVETLAAHLAYGNIKPRGWRRMARAVETQPALQASMVHAQVEEARRADNSHVVTTFTDAAVQKEVPKWMQVWDRPHAGEGGSRRVAIKKHV